MISSAAIVLSFLYVTYRLVDPLPPRHLAIAAGAAGSGYDNFAKQYARILARHGVELEIRNFAGALENLNSCVIRPPEYKPLSRPLALRSRPILIVSIP